MVRTTMPRSPDYIPQIGLHKGSGQAVVRLNGKDHYLGAFGSDASRERYDRLIAEWLANGRRLPARRNSATESEPIVADLIAVYLETHPGKRYANAKDALQRVFRLYASMPLRRFKAKHLRAVRELMLSDGLHARTVNDRVRRIKTVFRWGVVEELVTTDTMRSIEALRGIRAGASDIKPPPIDAVKRTIQAASPTIAAMIQVQALTAMRSGELVIMRSIDINFRFTDDLWLYVPFTHKTAGLGHERRIYIGPKAQGVIRPILDGLEPTEFIFTSSRTQRPYLPNGYYQAVRNAIRKSGAAHWFPHQLRHLTSTVVRADFGAEIAQGYAGHKSLKASEIYAERNERSIIEAARRIG